MVANGSVFGNVLLVGSKKAKKSALLTEGEVNALRFHLKAGLLRGGKT